MKIFGPLLTLVILSIALFGGFGRFLLFLFDWNQRFGAPYWPVMLILSAVCTAVISFYFYRAGYGFSSISSIFVGSLIVSSVLLVGLYAEISRRQSIQEFEADREFQNSFWESLHNAPADLQFFLHAGAMKNCVPHAWSYRTMTMYELNEDVMFNVLPWEWFAECGMEPHC